MARRDNYPKKPRSYWLLSLIPGSLECSPTAQPGLGPSSSKRHRLSWRSSLNWQPQYQLLLLRQLLKKKKFPKGHFLGWTWKKRCAGVPVVPVQGKPRGRNYQTPAVRFFRSCISFVMLLCEVKSDHFPVATNNPCLSLPSVSPENVKKCLLLGLSLGRQVFCLMPWSIICTEGELRWIWMSWR